MWNILPMPVVENFCGGVRVTFQRKNATENATDIATVKLNRTQEKIMAILHVDKRTRGTGPCLMTCPYASRD